MTTSSLKIIKDVIHRYVTVPKLCEKFMDTVEFNRLKKIRQLGLAHYVYPAATHTRFEHSIGVMFLAGEISRKFPDKITQREGELLQLAGLFHDAGHTGFSHLMDSFLEEMEVKSFHEERSVLLIRKINKRLGLLTDLEENIISDMIFGKNEKKEKPYLFEIICNNRIGIDIDRIDYLQRDLYHLGMQCFQADYILNSLCIVQSTDSGEHLSILEKAYYEVEMLFQARKRLFLLVCRHKTVVKVEKLIKEAMRNLRISEGFLETWEKLDDYRIMTRIEDECPEIYEKLCTRDFPHVTEYEIIKGLKYTNNDQIQGVLEKIPWVRTRPVSPVFSENADVSPVAKKKARKEKTPKTTLLLEYVTEKNCEKLKEFLQKNQSLDCNETLIHSAKVGNVEIFSCIIDNGGNYCYKNALKPAAKHGHKEIVSHLLNFSFSVDELKTAESYARKKGHETIASMLKKRWGEIMKQKRKL